MKKQFGLSLAGAMLLSLLSVGEAGAISLSASPSSQTVSEGDQFDVEVKISDLGDGSAPSLEYFDLNVDFDASVLGFERVVFGDPVLGNQLQGLFLPPMNDFELYTGSVNLSEASMDSANDLAPFQADSFTLATLTFNAVGTGSSDLEFSNVNLGGGTEELTASLLNGAVSVAAISPPTPPSKVPEPSVAFALVGLGIAAVGKRLYKSSR
ncbi:MAG: cohesin domain-containing protein [Hormoscilla sp.]